MLMQQYGFLSDFSEKTPITKIVENNFSGPVAKADF
jgi:hypothetical protein